MHSTLRFPWRRVCSASPLPRLSGKCLPPASTLPRPSPRPRHPRRLPVVGQSGDRPIDRALCHTRPTRSSQVPSSAPRDRSTARARLGRQQGDADQATLQSRARPFRGAKPPKAWLSCPREGGHCSHPSPQRSHRLLQDVCSVLIDKGSVMLANPEMDLTPAAITSLNGKLQQFPFDREHLDTGAAPAAR